MVQTAARNCEAGGFLHSLVHLLEVAHGPWNLKPLYLFAEDVTAVTFVLDRESEVFPAAELKGTDSGSIG
jgi:hypothetical protein